MTKIYEGCGEYTIHLESGRTITLNESELGEIADQTDQFICIATKVTAISDIADELEDICPAIKEIKEILKYNKHPENKKLIEEISNISGCLDNVRDIIQISTRQIIREY